MEQGENPPPPEAAPKPSAKERRAAIQEGQKRKRSRGFLYGLLAGQILVIAVNLGGNLLLKLFAGKYRLNAPVTLEALIFMGMAAGIAITALMIFFVLGLQAMGWTFGKKKAGFFTAVGRGMKRCFQAAWALGVTLGVVGGTAWFMIPGTEWTPTKDYLVEKGERALEKAKGLLPGKK